RLDRLTLEPLSRHPHAATRQRLHSSRFTLVADVVPMRYVAAPAESTLPENCTRTASCSGPWPALSSRSFPSAVPAGDRGRFELFSCLFVSVLPRTHR